MLGSFESKMYFAQHSSAFANAVVLDDGSVRDEAITDGLLKRLVVIQKLRAWMLPMPMGMIAYLTYQIPAHKMFWALIGALSVAQAVELFMAAWIGNLIGRGRRSRALSAGWLLSIVATGAAWGALMWPAMASLDSGINGIFNCITIVVTISIGAVMMAHLKRALYGYLVGVNLALLPEAIRLIPTLGVVSVIALCLLMSSLVLVSSMLTRQSREALIAELQNAQLASHLKQALSAAEFLSQRDSLTGLLNRRAFEEAADALGNSDAIPTTLILLDLDHFKKINDGYGHALGDDVLRSTARLMSNFVHPEALGTTPAEATARWGGEEFIVALGNCNLATALVAAEQLRARLAEYREAHWPASLRVTGSFGVTQWRADELLHEAIGRADKAMYQAKVAGRNLVMSIEHDDQVLIDTHESRISIATL